MVGLASFENLEGGILERIAENALLHFLAFRDATRTGSGDFDSHKTVEGNEEAKGED